MGVERRKRFWWRFLVGTSVNLRDPHKAENFFIISVTTSFLRRTPVPRISFVVRQPLVELGLLSVEASRSHSATPHTVVLLWTRDRPVAETCTVPHGTQHSQQTSMTLKGFEPSVPAVRGCKPTPQTARTLGSATKELVMRICGKTFKNTLKI